jgi:hypothetical protein
MSQFGPHGGYRAGLEFAVGGGCAKNHNAQLAVVGIRSGGIRGDKQGAQECRPKKCETASTGCESGHWCYLLTVQDRGMKKILICKMCRNTAFQKACPQSKKAQAAWMIRNSVDRKKQWATVP